MATRSWLRWEMGDMASFVAFLDLNFKTGWQPASKRFPELRLSTAVAKFFSANPSVLCCFSSLCITPPPPHPLILEHLKDPVAFFHLWPHFNLAYSRFQSPFPLPMSSKTKEAFNSGSTWPERCQGKRLSREHRALCLRTSEVAPPPLSSARTNIDRRPSCAAAFSRKLPHTHTLE